MASRSQEASLRVFLGICGARSPDIPIKSLVLGHHRYIHFLTRTSVSILTLASCLKAFHSSMHRFLLTLLVVICFTSVWGQMMHPMMMGPMGLGPMGMMRPMGPMMMHPGMGMYGPYSVQRNMARGAVTGKALCCGGALCYTERCGQMHTEHCRLVSP
nr:unnamed protein product [Haemonchus contortus]